MTEMEMQTRVFMRSLKEGRPVDFLIREALQHLNDGMVTAERGLPDWHKLVVLRSAVAAAMGVLEATELHV